MFEFIINSDAQAEVLKQAATYANDEELANACERAYQTGGSLLCSDEKSSVLVDALDGYEALVRDTPMDLYPMVKECLNALHKELDAFRTTNYKAWVLYRSIGGEE